MQCSIPYCYSTVKYEYCKAVELQSVANRKKLTYYCKAYRITVKAGTRTCTSILNHMCKTRQTVRVQDTSTVQYTAVQYCTVCRLQGLEEQKRTKYKISGKATTAIEKSNPNRPARSLLPYSHTVQSRVQHDIRPSVHSVIQSIRVTKVRVHQSITVVQ